MAGATAGGVTAILESVIICPLQRIKVWLMTSYSNTNYTAFWKLSTLRRLFDGFIPVVNRQLLSWISFLGTQQYFKELIYKFHNKTHQEHRLTNWQLILVSLVVCFTNTFVVMPADYVKTHYQKFSQFSQKKEGILHFIKSSYRQHGIKGFYRGGLIKIIHYNINSMLTVPMMEKMIRMMEK